MAIVSITGSICHLVYSYAIHTGGSSKADWNQKLSRTFFSTFSGNDNTRYGQRSESSAKMLYEKQTGEKIEKLGLYIRENYPWFGYSCDGVIFKEHETILIEVKSPIVLKTKAATYKSVEELPYITAAVPGPLRLRKNHLYYSQIQFVMRIMQIKKCILIIYSRYLAVQPRMSALDHTFQL